MFNRKPKYNAIRTYSNLCGRTFDSKGEAKRAEELRGLEMTGEISGLHYQVPFPLATRQKEGYKVTVKIDFAYLKDGQQIYEDYKGFLTRDSRILYAWVKQLYGIDILLTGKMLSAKDIEEGYTRLMTAITGKKK